jgi:hypothetical protein
MTFNTTLGCTNGTISNVAQGKAKEESVPATSNAADVATTCTP